MVEPDLNIDKQTAFDNNVTAGVAIDTDQVPDEATRMGGTAGAIRTHINTAPKTLRLLGGPGPVGKLATASALDGTVNEWVKWGNKRAGDVAELGDKTRINGENWQDHDKTGETDYGGGDFGAPGTELTPTPTPRPTPTASTDR